MTSGAPLVADASVAVKWVVTAEAHAHQAQQLLIDVTQRGQTIIAPPHLRGEVGNALYQRLRSTDPARHLTAEEAQRALADFIAIPLHIADPPGLYAEAFAIARMLSLASIYDSVYVALARMIGAELWTADLRLLGALGSSAPWVRPLGDYPLVRDP